MMAIILILMGIIMQLFIHLFNFQTGPISEDFGMKNQC